jgi:precorrin-8X/cobalt-precorrin-8 methylmutase
MKPEEIETLSFKLIDQEAGPHNFSSDEWRIVQRMIHTSADFEYIKTVRFHPKAITAGINAIRRGKTIITDTNMAKAGIRKQEVQRYGSNIICYINNPEVVKISGKTGKTRAEVAVDAAIPEVTEGIYVIGNAPTALFRLIERVKEHKARPALIIGLPVGFVNAAESKAALIGMDYPYISNVSRKGGSNIAASVVNALGKLAITV